MSIQLHLFICLFHTIKYYLHKYLDTHKNNAKRNLYQWIPIMYYLASALPGFIRGINHVCAFSDLFLFPIFIDYSEHICYICLCYNLKRQYYNAHKNNIGPMDPEGADFCGNFASCFLRT